jgi:hypothetical protein
MTVNESSGKTRSAVGQSSRGIRRSRCKPLFMRSIRYGTAPTNGNGVYDRSKVFADKLRRLPQPQARKRSLLGLHKPRDLFVRRKPDSLARANVLNRPLKHSYARTMANDVRVHGQDEDRPFLVSLIELGAPDVEDLVRRRVWPERCLPILDRPSSTDRTRATHRFTESPTASPLPSHAPVPRASMPGWD